MLSTNLEPVRRGQIRQGIAAALVIGGVASFCVMLATVGLRSEAAGGFHIGFLALKLLFTLSLIALGSGIRVSLL
jgi:Negative regulator of sigma F